MNKWLLSGALTVCLLSSTGCVTPIYSSSSDTRARQLIYTSENFRQITEIWERFWFLYAPDLATPYRTHGGVI